MVDRLMISLDPGSEVLKEALEHRCRCLVTHHPLLLRPIHTVRTDVWPGNIIAGAIVGGISIIAAHTNLDAAHQGTNAELAKLLMLQDVEPLEKDGAFSGDVRYLGIGLLGKLPETVPLEMLARRLSDRLNGADIKITGDPGKMVRQAAICTGSGGSLIGQVLGTAADVFITGDVKYHDGKLAQEGGLAVVDIGHYASEKLILEPLAAYLGHKAKDIGVPLEILVSRSERDPFNVIVGNR